MVRKKSKTSSWKIIIGYFLIILGFIFIIAKAIDYFVPGRALIPSLALIGMLSVVFGLVLIKKRTK